MITRTFAADHVTPVSAYAALRHHAPERSSFLLESILPGVPGERWGRYSIVGYRARSEGLYPPGGDVLELLSQDLSVKEVPESLAERFASAMVGYVSYDAVSALHRIPPWETESSLGRMIMEPTVVVFDHLHHTLTVAGRSNGAVNRCAWEMTHGPALDALPAPDPEGVPEYLEASMDDDAFAAKVARAKHYIAAGQASQVVLARTFRAPQRNADPFDVYRALRVLSPAAYLYYLSFAESPMAPGLVVAGASSQTLVRLERDRMTLRAIAGARPRGGSAEEDRALEVEMLADPRDRAAHGALVDLARADLDRVCEPGSVDLVHDRIVERHSRAMHVVTEVSGKRRGEVTPGQVLRAAFPAGGMTGAPKKRATEIIRELEVGPRGIYGGAIGYFLPDGSFDVAIAHRTVVFQDGQVEVVAGAAIGEGSEAEAEATRSEARAPLAALRAAQLALEAREAAEEARQKRLEAEEAKKLAAEAAKDEEPK